MPEPWQRILVVAAESQVEPWQRFTIVLNAEPWQIRDEETVVEPWQRVWGVPLAVAEPWQRRVVIP